MPIYFNPRSSCEERPRQSAIVQRAMKFQSTLLMRGATGWQQDIQADLHISIHAPHARSDEVSGINIPHGFLHFNPRSSCEERLRIKAPELARIISIHAPHARSDLCR